MNSSTRYAWGPLSEPLIFAYHRVKTAAEASEPHAGPRWVLNLTLKGEWRCGPPGGEQVAYETHDVALIRNTQLRTWSTPGKPPWEFLLCTFVPRPHWTTRMKLPEIVPGFMKLRLNDPALFRRVRAGLAEIHQLLQHRTERDVDFAFNTLERVLLLLHHHARRLEPGAHDARIEQAVRYIVNNLSKPITLTRLAAECCLSRSHLAALFKQHTGMGPIAFQQQQRIIRARELLTISNEPIRQIAFELGYNDPLYFSTFFKRHCGVSPRAFRRNAT